MRESSLYYSATSELLISHCHTLTHSGPNDQIYAQLSKHSKISGNIFWNTRYIFRRIVNWVSLLIHGAQWSIWLNIWTNFKSFIDWMKYFMEGKKHIQGNILLIFDINSGSQNSNRKIQKKVFVKYCPFYGCLTHFWCKHITLYIII